MKRTLILSAVLVLQMACSSPNLQLPQSSEKELKDNYPQKHKEIAALKTYFNSIVPREYQATIEFSSDKTIDFKVIYLRPASSDKPIRFLFQQWLLNPYTGKSELGQGIPGVAETASIDTVKLKLGWNDETFRTIKKYLDAANCVSVTNGEPATIGFKRSGMGMYFYNLFERRLTDSLKGVYGDTCRYHAYNDTVVLEYGGGATGSQCFPVE